jgi:hypothetical protein
MSDGNIPIPPQQVSHSRRTISSAIVALAGAAILAGGDHLAFQIVGGVVAAIGLGCWLWHMYRPDE